MTATHDGACRHIEGVVYPLDDFEIDKKHSASTELSWCSGSSIRSMTFQMIKEKREGKHPNLGYYPRVSPLSMVG